METINSALPVQLTSSASLRANEGTHLVGATICGAQASGSKVWATPAVIRTTVGVTPSYQGTAMPFAGRGRTTDLSIDVDGHHACAPPD